MFLLCLSRYSGIEEDVDLVRTSSIIQDSTLVLPFPRLLIFLFSRAGAQVN